MKPVPVETVPGEMVPVETVPVPPGTRDDGAGADVALADRRARALGSALRLRILRFCLHEPHTNREIAAEFGLNPGTSLHHVRTLIDTGLLAAGDPRRGTRGAREVPYRATGISWRTHVPGISAVLVRAFLDDIEGVAADDIQAWRMGFLLGDEDLAELSADITNLIVKYRARPIDPRAHPVSLFVGLHPERRGRATP
ncbi:MAG: winged helix-turn-helix domain-containing protein [Pseudolysinimonas sp.]|uniref:ArsR/SmtB family transcription factor n=1 Tax=Pseudolysinimonas sp. TaxID=2680009 RepID=UPI0032665631